MLFFRTYKKLLELESTFTDYVQQAKEERSVLQQVLLANAAETKSLKDSICELGKTLESLQELLKTQNINLDETKIALSQEYKDISTIAQTQTKKAITQQEKILKQLKVSIENTETTMSTLEEANRLLLLHTVLSEIPE